MNEAEARPPVNQRLVMGNYLELVEAERTQALADLQATQTRAEKAEKAFEIAQTRLAEAQTAAAQARGEAVRHEKQRDELRARLAEVETELARQQQTDFEDTMALADVRLRAVERELSKIQKLTGNILITRRRVEAHSIELNARTLLDAEPTGQIDEVFRRKVDR